MYLDLSDEELMELVAEGDEMAFQELAARVRIVLIKRRQGDVAANAWALPGGFVDFRERLVHAVVREVAEETGLEAAQVRFFGVYDDPERDMTESRNNVSIIYTAVGLGALRLAPDAKGRYEVAAVRGFTQEEIRDTKLRPCPKDAGPSPPLVVVAPDMGLTAENFDEGSFEIGFDHAQILDDYFRTG